MQIISSLGFRAAGLRLPMAMLGSPVILRMGSWVCSLRFQLNSLMTHRTRTVRVRRKTAIRISRFFILSASSEGDLIGYCA